MTDARIARKVYEVKDESNIVYKDVYEYIKEKHGTKTSLAVMTALLAIGMRLWRGLEIENDNPVEKEIAKSIMDRFLEYVVIHRAGERIEFEEEGEED
jgi:uncharacterized membrane protein